MKNNRILYISQEITPYLPQTPLAILGNKAPIAMQEKGYEVRTFMPKYGAINERRNQLHEVIRLSGMNIIIDDCDHPLIIKVATLQPARMQVYFIDNDDYFHHPTSVSDKSLETESHPEDNDERSIFYVRGVIETVKKLRWEPAIVQCMGWITALAPAFLKKVYNDDPSFENTLIIYTLRSEQLPSTLPAELKQKLSDHIAPEALEELGQDEIDLNALHRLAIRYADAIVQADPDIDPEVIEFARQSGKPFMAYTSAETIADDMAKFNLNLLERDA